MPPPGEAYFQTEYALQALHLAKVLDKLERRHRGHQRHKPSQVRAGRADPSQGGQYNRNIPLEEGMAQIHGPTICEAPLYAAAGSGTGLWPHFMQCRSLD